MNLSRTQPRRLDPASLRLPLIALIDVVLFLLFYFIVAGTIAAEEAELSTTLAIGSAKSNPSYVGSAVLRIEWEDGQPLFRTGGRTSRGRNELFQIVRQLPKEPGIVIRADDDVELQSIAAAMQVVKDAGFTKITYVPSR